MKTGAGDLRGPPRTTRTQNLRAERQAQFRVLAPMANVSTELRILIHAGLPKGHVLGRVAAKVQGMCVPPLREACYEIARTASTICLAEMPKASRSSSGLPECGISRTAMSCDLVGATLACARADRTASPIPPSAQ
jgi:hypothetical protein